VTVTSSARVGSAAGSAAAPSLLEIRAAVDEARDRLAEASSRAERARFAIGALSGRVAEASDTVEAALDQLHESDAKMSAVAERLGALGAAVRSARAEAERTERAIAVAEAALEAERDERSALAERYDAAVGQPASSAGADGEVGDADGRRRHRVDRRAGPP
jgi:chromosome segregation protein